jgi:hypothetical protein
VRDCSGDLTRCAKAACNNPAGAAKLLTVGARSQRRSAGPAASCLTQGFGALRPEKTALVGCGVPSAAG